MILDIIQTIIDTSNKLSDQLSIMKINKDTYENCYIYALTTPTNMTKKIFRQKKYSKIKKLVHYQDSRNSRYINSVNHLADTLEILICAGPYWIRQKGIKKLKKLRILDCGNSNYIRNVNHLGGTLEELYCGSLSCGIEQSGISELKKLKKIECCVNGRIKNLNHLKDTLQIVDCSGKRIYKKHMDISQANGAKNFDVLFGTLKQEGISELKKVVQFNCSDNCHIHDVNHMAGTLELLKCGGDRCGINQDGISKLKKLKKINCCDNINIHNLDHMAGTLDEILVENYYL